VQSSVMTAWPVSIIVSLCDLSWNFDLNYSAAASC
jgi:hypothetical protein